MSHLMYHPEKCIGCGGCEVICSLRRDEYLSTMTSSIMFYLEEEKGYFGIIVKRENGELLLGRPEGVEVKRPGEISGGSAAAKPITMRPPCDMCGGEPKCIRYCPTGALEEGD